MKVKEFLIKLKNSVKKQYLFHKQLFWIWFIHDLLKYPEACDFNWWMKILYVILFPLEWIRWNAFNPINKTWNGYNPMNDIWTIHGKKYSGRLFDCMEANDNKWYRIISKPYEDETVVTVQRTDINKTDIKIKVYQRDWIPGFGAYLSNDKFLDEKGEAFVELNLGSLLAAVKSTNITKQELPYVVAETIMHEVIHVLEEWAKVEFNEDKVEKLLEAYYHKYRDDGYIPVDKEVDKDVEKIANDIDAHNFLNEKLIP